MHVLIVDDHLSEAESFARLIEANTGLSCTSTDDPDHALQLAEATLFGVVVLDQSMPRMEGTDLYERLRVSLPAAKALMLTQEDDSTAVADALNLGFTGHLHKARVAELSDRVMSLHIAYETSRARADPVGEIVYERKHFFRTQATVRLQTSEELDDRFIDTDEWETLVQINAGQERKISRTISSKHGIAIENELTKETSVSLGLKATQIVELSQGIEAKLVQRSKTAVQAETAVVEVLEETYRLPQEPVDPTTLHVKSRLFEGAPVYRRHRLVLVSECRCCDRKTWTALVVRERLPMLAFRQVDFLSDGTERALPTGFRRRQESAGH